MPTPAAGHGVAMRWTLIVVGLLVLVAGSSCGGDRAALEVSKALTLAELRAVKGELSVTAPGEAARPPYPRERLVDGQRVDVPQGGLAWIRRDGGATWLVSGKAGLTMRAARVDLDQGRAFIDSELGDPVQLRIRNLRIELSDARASVEVTQDAVRIYVLRGSARAGDAARATAGELLTIGADGRATRVPVVSWEDWTGGLATADPAAEPAPFGIGTVGARRAGDQGTPRFSLVIERLDVAVTLCGDFAMTEVSETFVNPSSDVVEGIFSFRTPPGAVLSRFGVDRDGVLVWGRVQEVKSAVAQYQSNVYAGSEEDPALLTWAGPGVYKARLYPIGPGQSRHVVTRYTEWLPRHGHRGERRLYVYPMAAEGARGSLPRIEELRFTVDLRRAAAQRVRVGMGGKREGNTIVVKAYDFVPRADLAVELFDGGRNGPVAYRAPHRLGPSDVAEDAANGFASQVADEEADYLAVPLRLYAAPGQARSGIDLGIVVDTSAATEPGALAIARSMASSLLAHLGPEDRASLWAGDAKLRPVSKTSSELGPVNRNKLEAWLGGLASIERGGATDLGALLTEAASRLDPKRPGAIVYIGDGQPSVGELLPKSLRDRLARLSPTTRLLAAAVGPRANVALLESLVRGAPVEQVSDAYGAARAALRLLEAAGRPAWIGARVDFGPGVDRVLPRELRLVSSEETVLVVGRVRGKLPTSITVSGSGETLEQRLSVRSLADSGDLRKRWGGARLDELTQEGSGRASLVELARRFGLVSPFTALYVPTKREVAAQDEPEEDPEESEQAQAARRMRWKPWLARDEIGAINLASAPASLKVASDDKEGGTGTRATGEEGSMGSPMPKPSSRRYAVAGPKDEQPEPAALAEAREVLTAEEAPAAIADLEQKSRVPLTADNPAPAPAAPPAVKSTGRLSARRAGGGFPLGSPGIGSSGGYVSRPSSIEQEPEGADELKKVAGPHQPAAPDATRPEAPRDGRHPAERPARPALGHIGHDPRPCGPGADLPLSERIVLWRERLSVSGSSSAAVAVYVAALRNCEATRWDERTRLLLEMVDRLPGVTDRVELWRSMLAISPAAADAVYRFLIVRVQTAQDLKELHDALGLERIDATLLEALLKRAATASERLSLLRGAAERFPDDAELALLVLDAYEDAKDDAGGRAWARRLRRRVDATAHVRTSVGEYYLRLAARGLGAAAERDAEEGRRTFGELVEFAPEDPLARRRLGDLLRAHGWYEEALRQYQTLAALTPEDPSVLLLIATAAEGMGKVEEAVRWTEKAAATGSPDGASPIGVAARALASVFLAWAREDSTRAGNPEEADRLRTRAARLASSESSTGLRVVLTWSHPELRPALWTHALGSPMPAPDNLPLYGVAQAYVPEAPAPVLELRLDPEDAARAARLDARAILTVLSGEGTAAERIARAEVGFRGGDRKPLSRVVLRFEHGRLSTETGAPQEAP